MHLENSSLSKNCSLFHVKSFILQDFPCAKANIRKMQNMLVEILTLHVIQINLKKHFVHYFVCELTVLYYDSCTVSFPGDLELGGHKWTVCTSGKPLLF